MKSLKETDEIVKEEYRNAKEIYSLSREKAKLSGGEKIVNAAIFLFTPFVKGVKTMNALSDLGIYYLVEDNNKQFLVRISKVESESLIQKIDITGKFVGEKFTNGESSFRKIRKL